VEAAGGIILLIAAAVALLWANSGLHESYQALWHTGITLGRGNWTFREDLHFWINEGLMTVFFLVVGLEIKREIVQGALADWSRATLPIAGAIGGMLVPAGIYLLLNPTGPAHEGWGVPMATDIAFAVGVLTLLGKRVSPSMRILLLAVAIIDDIGAILVIAIFYSAGIDPQGIGIAFAGLLLLFAFQRVGTRPGWMYVIPLLVIWTGMLVTGIHPTISGVIVGLATPVRPWVGTDRFVGVAKDALDDFHGRAQRGATDHELIQPLHNLAFAQREAISPAVRLENALHPWVAYVIMPVFALANAGVNMGGMEFSGPGFVTVLAGTILGLTIGKPLGVMLAIWIAVRLRLSVLPAGVTWASVFVIGSVAGIGFTMAIFIAELAFSDPALLGVAKLGVLAATAIAATMGLLAGRTLLKPPSDDTAQPTDTEVEASTDIWLSGSLTTARASHSLGQLR
jgi:NhaA family Na+:H+ antiporter